MSCEKHFLNFFVFFVIGILVTDARAPQKLLGATVASRGDFKYQVSVIINHRNHCGGALISERHVLTAAHCFVSQLDPPYTKGLVILTGTTSLTHGGEHHYAEYVTIHPQYVKGNSSNHWRHDIAVVTLVTPAVKNEFQAPVALPSSDTTTEVQGVVSGWGQLRRGWDGEYPDNLRMRSVTILTQDDCKSRRIILDTQICGLDGEDTGFCHGDSGGPLVYNNEVVGLVSYAVLCGIGYPDVYTRVWSYRDFIADAMKR